MANAFRMLMDEVGKVLFDFDSNRIRLIFNFIVFSLMNFMIVIGSKMITQNFQGIAENISSFYTTFSFMILFLYLVVSLMGSFKGYFRICSYVTMMGILVFFFFNDTGLIGISMKLIMALLPFDIGYQVNKAMKRNRENKATRLIRSVARKG